MQHYRLQRDFEIAVEDERGFGNGLLLPAGPLREPAGRRVDATVVNGAERSPAHFACGSRRPVCTGSMAGAPLAQSELSGKKLHASPESQSERFFRRAFAHGLEFSAPVSGSQRFGPKTSSSPIAISC